MVFEVIAVVGADKTMSCVHEHETSGRGGPDGDGSILQASARAGVASLAGSWCMLRYGLPTVGLITRQTGITLDAHESTAELRRTAQALRRSFGDLI